MQTSRQGAGLYLENRLDSRFASILGRRALLSGTAAGSLLLLSARLAPANLTTDKKGVDTIAGLTPLMAAVFTAAIEAIIHSPLQPLPPVDKTFVLEDVGKAALTLPPALYSQLELLARAIEWGTPLFRLKAGTFTSLPVETRLAVLAEWSTSRLALRRVAVVSLKMLLMAFYWAQPTTWQHLGYDGPFLDREQVPYFESFLGMNMPLGPLPLLPEPGVAPARQEP